MKKVAIKEDEIVAWAYRLFLDREPEDRAAIDTHRGFGNTATLRQRFLSSSEFELRNPGSQKPPWNELLSKPPLHIEYDPPSTTMEALRLHVQRNWTRLGAEAPHWSVLSADIFRPENIGEHEKSFFNSGAVDAAVVKAILKRYGLEPREIPWVFEFGCGIGRVTLHLAKMFERVVACDISENHLAVGREHAERNSIRNIDWREVDSEEFGMIESIPFWFSRIVLQHNPPPIIAQILARMFDMLQPGGIAAFQVPTYADGYSFSAKDYLAAMGGIEQVEMHCLPQNAIYALASSRGCELLEVLSDDSVGVPNWTSHNFVFRKLPPK